MLFRSTLFLIAAPLAMCVGFWACVTNPDNSTVGSGASSASGLGGVGGIGGGGSSTTMGTGAGVTINCTRDNGSDPVGLCTQKLVLRAEHMVAFDATRGVAQSWDSKTGTLDEDASHMVLHDPRDDAGYAAAVARYAQSAVLYGDTEIGRAHV